MLVLVLMLVLLHVRLGVYARLCHALCLDGSGAELRLLWREVVERVRRRLIRGHAFALVHICMLAPARCGALSHHKAVGRRGLDDAARQRLHLVLRLAPDDPAGNDERWPLGGLRPSDGRAAAVPWAALVQRPCIPRHSRSSGSPRSSRCGQAMRAMSMVGVYRGKRCSHCHPDAWGLGWPVRRGLLLLLLLLLLRWWPPMLHWLSGLHAAEPWVVVRLHGWRVGRGPVQVSDVAAAALQETRRCRGVALRVGRRVLPVCHAATQRRMRTRCLRHQAVGHLLLMHKPKVACRVLDVLSVNEGLLSETHWTQLWYSLCTEEKGGQGQQTPPVSQHQTAKVVFGPGAVAAVFTKQQICTGICPRPILLGDRHIPTPRTQVSHLQHWSRCAVADWAC